ncbi:unnamed protein product, partial [Mesorhabditis belari]|uniref:DOCKER domain-containing protein n=1 Tax=Mesorhabditis belari TaxID=2138241 RepID=A0AAF3FIV5_9BILA
MISPPQSNKIKQGKKNAEGRLAIPDGPIMAVEMAPPKPPGRLRKFAAVVRRPGFAKEARDAIQDVISTSQKSSNQSDQKITSKKSDTLGSNDSVQSKDDFEEEKRSLPSSGSSAVSIFRFDSISSTKSFAKLRKFTSNLGPLGSAKEAREAIQKAISSPNFSDKPTISSIFDYERFLNDKGIIGNDSQPNVALLPKDDVEIVVGQLGHVLEATNAFVSATYDQIKLTELHISLANSYRDFATYRSLWFVALAELHSASGWHSEAAVAYGHVVVVIAKELFLKGTLVSPDWSVFDSISSAIAIDENVKGSLWEDVQPGGFTLDELLEKIDRCCHELTLAERFEAIGPLYRFIIPTLEAIGNYKLLSAVYSDLHKAAIKADERINNGRRHLGTYFKVVFLGEKQFGKSLHQSEWIYHESGLTSLAEVSLSLLEYCRQLLGHDNIKIEPEKELNISTLDQSFAYVQITHVEPLCADNEKQDFRTHTNLRDFFYETPVVENWDSRCKGEPPVQHQALRRTIVSVVGSFPSNRRRLAVDKGKREHVILTPLEFASQKLRTKASQILRVVESASSGKQLDFKGLQLLLQGVLMPSVNAGPLAYADAFSQPDQLRRYGAKGVTDLCDSFRQLTVACEMGLQANERVIGSDQRKYHAMLVKSAETMVERLTGAFGDMFPTPFESNLELPRSKTNSLDSFRDMNVLFPLFAGKMGEQKNINWMYEGVKSDVNREDYLLGKRIDKNFEKYSDAVIDEKAEGVEHVVSNRVVSSGANVNHKVSHINTVTMRLDDPLVNLKVKEEMRRREILENPLMKLKMEKAIKEMMAEKMQKEKKMEKAIKEMMLEKKQKKAKKQKKEHKHERKKEKKEKSKKRQRNESSSEDDSESEKEAKHSRSRRRSERQDDSDDERRSKPSKHSSRHRNKSQESSDAEQITKTKSSLKSHRSARRDSSSEEDNRRKRRRVNSRSPPRKLRESSEERPIKRERRRHDSSSPVRKERSLSRDRSSNKNRQRHGSRSPVRKERRHDSRSPARKERSVSKERSEIRDRRRHDSRSPVRRDRRNSSEERPVKKHRQRHDSESPVRRSRKDSEERSSKQDTRKRRDSSSPDEDDTEEEKESIKKEVFSESDEDDRPIKGPALPPQASSSAAYGLIGGKKKDERKDHSPKGQEQKFFRFTKAQDFNKRPTTRVKSSAMTEEEKEARLRAMQANVDWHYKKRDDNIAAAKTRDMEEEERDKERKPASFIRDMVSKAQNDLSMEDRLKSNKRNLQRGFDHMDKSFTKR